MKPLKETSMIQSMLLLIVLCLSSLPVWARSAEDMYREAQIQETAARDPKAAIHLYEEFLAQPEIDPSRASDALLHVGICHQRLGHTQEAMAAWRKVTENYADQPAYTEALAQLQASKVPERIVEV